MAKNKKSKKRRTPDGESSYSAVGVAGDEPQSQPSASSGGPDGSGGDSGRDGNGGNGDWSGPGSPGGRSPVSAGSGAGFLTIYKPGQGYFTRLGTAIGGGLVLIFGANFVYQRLAGLDPAVQLGVPSLFLAVSGLVLFWIAGSGRKTNDFFIATEGEMKKVSWSTKKEIIGSTKVVLAFTLVMTTFLFVVDIFFMFIFSWIGVLQIDMATMFGFGQ